MSGSGTNPPSAAALHCLIVTAALLLVLVNLAAGVTTMVFALVFMLCYIGDVPQARGTIPLVIDAIWCAAGFCFLLPPLSLAVLGVPHACGTIPLVIDAIWWAAGFR